MKRFSRYSRYVMLAAVLAAAVAAPLQATAQARPLPQRQISRGAPSTTHVTPHTKINALGGATHILYGTISSVKGAALVVRTRGGRLQPVDATQALAAGTYSAPLFVGKVVAVNGYYDAAKTLHAQSVTRMTKLDPSTSADH